MPETIVNPFSRGTFNLTKQMVIHRQNPALAARLRAEAKAAAVAAPGPRKAPPRPRPAPYVPNVQPFPAEEPQEEPAPLPPPPRMTIIVQPSVDDDLRAALTAAVATVTTARADTFPTRGEVLEVLARLKDAPDDLDPAPVRVFPDAGAVLARYRNVTDPDAADFAGRLAALLHVALRGPESTAPLDPGTVDRSLQVVEWLRRVTAPPKAPEAAAPEVDPSVLPLPQICGNGENAPVPDVEHGADEPLQPAGGDPGDVQRLKDLLAANPGQPFTARDAGRKLKLSAARIREIIANDPRMFRVSEHGTQPSGGRPAQRLALVGPAV